MDGARAQIILGIAQTENSPDEIAEQYEEAVFEQASFFMRRTYHPILGKARIKKLQKIQEAADTLGVSIAENTLTIEMPDFGSPSSLLETVKEYQAAEARLKLMLSKVRTALQGIQAFGIWNKVFANYAKNYVIHYERIAGKPDLADSKLSSQVDMVALLGELEIGDFQHLSLEEYGRLKKSIT